MGAHLLRRAPAALRVSAQDDMSHPALSSSKLVHFKAYSLGSRRVAGHRAFHRVKLCYVSALIALTTSDACRRAASRARPCASQSTDPWDEVAQLPVIRILVESRLPQMRHSIYHPPTVPHGDPGGSYLKPGSSLTELQLRSSESCGQDVSSSLEYLNRLTPPAL